MTETVWGKIEVRQTTSVPKYWTWVIYLSWNDSRKWEHSVETEWVYKVKASALAAAKLWCARLGIKDYVDGG